MITAPHPIRTAVDARRAVARLATLRGLPAARTVDLTPAGLLSIQLATRADVDAWAVWLGTLTISLSQSYGIRDLVTVPELGTSRVDVFALHPVYGDPR